MDSHVIEFFSPSGTGDDGPQGHFHQVIALHDHPEIQWNEVLKKVPNFPRGWFELAHLPPQDRVDFKAEYWASKIPFHPHVLEGFADFFKTLDDIGIFITQQKYDDPFDATMVYSIKGDGGFYRGQLPATYSDCMELQECNPEHIFPEDYLAFLQIHNGFRKTVDSTGILTSKEVPLVYQRLQDLIDDGEYVTTRTGVPVDPSSLIPFYESFGLPQFQCFWEEWHHEQGMGNVYYSISEKVVSDPDSGEMGSDNLAFPTFSEWLLFYLERVN